MPKELVTALCLWVAFSAGWAIWRGLKYKMWKLGLKEFAQSILSIGSLLWVLFFIVVSVSVLPAYMRYLETVPFSNTSKWVIDLLPFFYTLSVLGLVFFILYKVAKWHPKYTSEEKEVLKQEKIKFKNKLGFLGRWIKVEGE